MAKLTRRTFIATSLAAAAVRVMPQGAVRPGGRHILTLVYDKSLGMMRAIDQLVP